MKPNLSLVDFSSVSISKIVTRLALPQLVAELVHVLYTVVDRIYIGHMNGIGTSALSGIGLSLPLITLIGAFANLCSLGASSLCSIALGKKDMTRAQRLQETSFFLLCSFAVTLTILFRCFSIPVLKLLGADDISLPFAADYFEIYILGTVFSMLTLGMNAYITVQGFPLFGMITNLIGSVSNIFLDPLFIYTLDMGIKGAALASVISQFLSMCWIIYFYAIKTILPLQHFRISWDCLRPILSLGATGFAFKITNSITQAIVNIVLVAYSDMQSSIYIALLSIILSLRSVFELPIDGFANGAQPVLGYNYGAGNFERVRATIRFLTAVIFALSFISWLLALLFPKLFIRILSSDEQLLSQGIPAMRIYFSAYFLMTGQHVGQTVFVALNHPKYAVFFSLFRKLFLVLPMTLLLPATGLGVIGVFLAEPISEAVGGIVCYTVMNKKIFQNLKSEADCYLLNECEKRLQQ